MKNLQVVGNGDDHALDYSVVVHVCPNHDTPLFLTKTESIWGDDWYWVNTVRRAHLFPVYDGYRDEGMTIVSALPLRWLNRSGKCWRRIGVNVKLAYTEGK